MAKGGVETGGVRRQRTPAFIDLANASTIATLRVIAATMDVPCLSAIPSTRRWVADGTEGARPPSSRKNVRVTFRFPAGAELAGARYPLAAS